MSEWPTWASIDLTVSQCDCCGKKHLKRTIKLSSPDIGELHLGVTCAGNWFDLNLSGNPYKAAKKLERQLKFSDDEETDEIFSNIREAIRELREG